MSKNNLSDRLNQILPRITSDDFLSGSGLGNEIAFYIFDYPPEDELVVRDFLKTLMEHLPKEKPGIKVKNVNMFYLVLEYLESRKKLESVLQTGRSKGDNFLKDELLKGPLVPERLASYFGTSVAPKNLDLVIVSGIGSAYPLVRTHSMLSNLHSIMGKTPLVMFYPGKYDQVSLRLFGKMNLSTTIEADPKSRKPENYYRAFKLVP